MEHGASRVGGAVAQLGERRFCKPEVVGSIPISSTSSVQCSDAVCIETRPGISCTSRPENDLFVGRRSLTTWTGNPSESKRVVAHPGDCDRASEAWVPGRNHGQATKGTRWMPWRE